MLMEDKPHFADISCGNAVKRVMLLVSWMVLYGVLLFVNLKVLLLVGMSTKGSIPFAGSMRFGGTIGMVAIIATSLELLLAYSMAKRKRAKRAPAFSCRNARTRG